MALKRAKDGHETVHGGQIIQDSKEKGACFHPAGGSRHSLFFAERDCLNAMLCWNSCWNWSFVDDISVNLAHETFNPNNLMSWSGYGNKNMYVAKVTC